MTRPTPFRFGGRAALAGLVAICMLYLPTARAADAFVLASPGLTDGATLNARHAASARDCGGGNVSPALQWRHAPAGTRSFAVTIFDPDGAKGLGVVHWMQYGIPASVDSLAEGGAMPAGSVGGVNRTGHTGYFGPCPPVGDIAHHYVVQAYALDLAPDALPAGLTRDALLVALKDHVLAATSIVLRYAR